MGDVGWSAADFCGGRLPAYGTDACGNREFSYGPDSATGAPWCTRRWGQLRVACGRAVDETHDHPRCHNEAASRNPPVARMLAATFGVLFLLIFALIALAT